MIFPCTNCGACCRRIKQVIERVNCSDPTSDFYFPYKYNEAGQCENLTDDNLCSIYSDRPLICDIIGLGERFGVLDKQYINDNINACNKLQEEDEMPLKFRIKRI